MSGDREPDQQMDEDNPSIFFSISIKEASGMGVNDDGVPLAKSPAKTLDAFSTFGHLSHAYAHALPAVYPSAHLQTVTLSSLMFTCFCVTISITSL